MPIYRHSIIFLRYIADPYQRISNSSFCSRDITRNPEIQKFSENLKTLQKYGCFDTSGSRVALFVPEIGKWGTLGVKEKKDYSYSSMRFGFLRISSKIYLGISDQTVSLQSIQKSNTFIYSCNVRI